MKVKTEYQGIVMELHRSLGSVRFLVNGEVRAMTGGKLMHHKVDQSYEATLQEGSGRGAVVKAELQLGWLIDTVYFYVNDQLVDKKRLL